MQEKSLIERFVSFGAKRASSTIEKAKEVVQVARLLGPVIREVPALWNTGRIINEGVTGWAFTAVSLLADKIATNPTTLYKKKGSNWVAIDSDPLLELLNNPNPYQDGKQFMWLTAGYLLAVGESFWVLNDAKNPTEMVVYNPAKVVMKFDDSNMLSGYEFLLANGQRRVVEKDLVVFLSMPDLKNPLRGSGIMNSVAQAVDSDNYMQEYFRTFFYNNATPGGVLETESEELDDAQGKQLLKSFEARHLGRKKQHRLAILTHGLKYKPTESSFKDLEMSMSNDSVRDRILSAFRVPKSVLGITTDVNLASAQAVERSFMFYAVLPKLLMIESQINQRLVSKFTESRNMYFEFQNPVVEDAKIQAETRAININSGVRTADEYRAEDGLQGLGAGADAQLVVDNTQKRLQKSLNERINSKKSLSNKDKYLQEVEKTVMEEARKIVKKQMDAKKKGMAEVQEKTFQGPFTEEMVAEYHQKKLNSVETTEKNFSSAVLSFKMKEWKAIEKQLVGKSKRTKAIDIIYDEAQQADLFSALSVPYMKDSLLAQASLSYALLQMEETMTPQDKRVKNYLKTWSVKLGKESTQTTKDFIDKTLKDFAETEDASIADLRTTLKDYFDDSAKADMIARTEVSRATGYAQEEVYKEGGAVGKQWITADDERTCEFCSEMDGVIVGTDENFVEKGDDFAGASGGVLSIGYSDVKSAPLHPSCRCDLIPVFDGAKMAESSLNFKKLQNQMLAVESKKKTLEQKEEELRQAEANLKKAKLEHEKEVEENLLALEEINESET